MQRIFVKERQKSIGSQAVQGIKWFGLAILVWGIGALGNLLFIEFFGVSSKLVIYWGLVISLANSLFILLSLPSIEHSKSRGLGVRLVAHFTTKEFVMLYSVVLGMITFVFVAASFSNDELNISFTWLIDIPISIFVALSLLFELNKAFSARQMKFMYLPTFVLFVLIVVAVSHRIIPQDQVVQIIDQEFWSVVGTITSISFKFLFILLFSILLYSWKFLSEKEQQQSLAQDLSSENAVLKKELEQLTIANESHIDTIKHLKSDVIVLKKATKIELSERQKEVLANLAFGGIKKSYPELAAAMNISLDGLQTHIHQIKKILNVSGTGGKEQLIEFAIKNDMLQFATLEKAD
jgi:DNA-binding CsgD family transcriptional regulator